DFDVSAHGVGEEGDLEADGLDVFRGAVETDAERGDVGGEGIHVGHFEADVVDGCPLRALRRVAARRQEIDAAAGNHRRGQVAAFTDFGPEDLDIPVAQGGPVQRGQVRVVEQDGLGLARVARELDAY